MTLFKSLTYGECDIERMSEIIIKRVKSKPQSRWTLSIGTDSQNKHTKTKFVTAVILVEKGSGGIYFHSSKKSKRIQIVKNRMLKEADLSIEVGKRILDNFSNQSSLEAMNLEFEIHCDLGTEGKSSESILETYDRIEAEFQGAATPKIKPDSSAASCVADKYTRARKI